MTAVSFSLVVLLSLLSVVCSAPLYHRHGSLSDAASASPLNPWRATSVAPPDQPHSLILALTQHNLDRLRALHRDIHDPTHPLWLQHLTPQQLHDITAPPPNVPASIIAWLTSHGIPASSISYPIGSDTIRVTAAVHHLNAAFNTSLHTFTHLSGLTAVRQLGPSSIPDELAPHIEFVDGLALFPLHLRRHGHVRSLSASTPTPSPPFPSLASNASLPPTLLQQGSADCSSVGIVPIFPPNSLYSHYNIPDQSSLSQPSAPVTSTSSLQFWTSDSNGKAVANSFSPTDIASWAQLWSNGKNPNAFSISPVSGPNVPSNPQAEPSLDTQSLATMSPTSAQSFELTSDISVQVFGWASAFTPRPSIPQVVSISYGLPEAVFLTGAQATLDGISYATYLDRTNTEFMKITARGTTILASSGDDGAPSTANPNCDYNSAPDFGGQNYRLYVEFPASSPYVVAVGATEIDVPTCASFPTQLPGSTAPMCSQLTAGKLTNTYGLQHTSRWASGAQINCWNPNTGYTEQAVFINLTNPNLGSTFNGGGGFSRHFARSSYSDFQAPFISAWQGRITGSTAPPAGYYDATYRGLPDVAMFGSFIPINVGGVFTEAAGTSLSAPLFGGVIALLNNLTMASKGATIGWANPLLYALKSANANAFTDITMGSNACPNNFNDDGQCSTAAGTSQCVGFSAIQGWDPVTGLGVPNVGVMMSALTSLIAANQVALATGTGNVSDIRAYTGTYPGGAASLRTRGAEAIFVALLTVLLAAFIMHR